MGVAYERRIYAFRFETTAEQDDALHRPDERGPESLALQPALQQLRGFCARHSQFLLSRTFRRSIFPDAGMTTPNRSPTSWRATRASIPETQLAVFEIPQVPGYRRQSHSNKSIAESLITTGYAIPIALMNPYLAGGLFVDFLVRGRYHLIPSHPEILGPENLMALTAPATPRKIPAAQVYRPPAPLQTALRKLHRPEQPTLA